MDRDKKIIKVSIQGIGVNLILVIFKMIVGLIANSIAIILDAVNNLSDALSSIITIIGTKLSNKRPNKKTSLRLWKNRIFFISNNCNYSFICRYYII